MTDLAANLINQFAAHPFVRGLDPGRVQQQLSDNGFSALGRLEDHVIAVGVPGVSLSVQQQTIGVRCGLWPQDSLRQQRSVILSSRLGQQLDQQTDWFAAFRAFARQLDPKRDVLLTSKRSTADRFVRRTQSLFGLSVYEVMIPKRSRGPADSNDWLPECPAGKTISLGPPLSTIGPNPRPEPTRDRALAILANRVCALRVREDSNTHRILVQRLKMPGFPDNSVLVSDHAAAQPVAAELLAAGAVPLSASEYVAEPAGCESPAQGPETVSGLLNRPLFDDYLLHWTRRPPGKWPDESADEFFDALILGSAGNRSPMDALCRIVRSRRLLATRDLTRGGRPVVCFSGNRIHDLPPRTYRRHLRRWDYEPFGIAIRRTWLEDHGARPVVYGTETEFQTLDDELQPFFQPSETADGKVDWVHENEWRVIGDLELTDLSSADAFVFVPSIETARSLQAVCRWPVLPLGAMSG